MPVKHQNREMFNDGIISVYSTVKRKIDKKVTELRYGNRTIGVTRFYQAKIEGSGIDNLISVPLNSFINAESIVIKDKIQYEIKQIQYKYDTTPPSQYVTLKKVTNEYQFLESGD